MDVHGSRGRHVELLHLESGREISYPASRHVACHSSVVDLDTDDASQP